MSEVCACTHVSLSVSACGLKRVIKPCWCFVEQKHKKPPLHGNLFEATMQKCTSILQKRVSAIDARSSIYHSDIPCRGR